MPGVTAGNVECRAGQAGKRPRLINVRTCEHEHGWTRVKHGLREDGGDLHWHRPGLINHISEITKGYIIAYYT